MSNVLNVLEKFNVKRSDLIKEYKAEGKKIIGCSPYHLPVELVYAGGMIPMGIWGSQGEVVLAKQFFPAFYCSIVQRSMEMALNGTLDVLDGMMVSIQCDSLKAFGQNIKRAIGDKVPYIHVAMAQNRKIECGIDFNETQYRKVKEQLEKISGNIITDEAVNEAIKLYNKSKVAMQEFVQLAAKCPHLITPTKRSLVLTLANSMDRKKYLEILTELNEALRAEEEKEWDGIKIVTTGIYTSLDGLNEIFEENKMAIVDDEVAEESRQFRTLVDEDTDNPIRALAKYLGDIEGCSLMYDPDKKRSDMLIEKVKKSGADAVVYIQAKFCDPEEFDYPIFKKALAKEGIKLVMIEVDQQQANLEQARTALQTFAEML
ncbi:MAG: 2-hydroxyacyl-CoA dehydratase family protein [Eubacteriales bacterium]|nr:2-hydroxyacyl-CoA dehydratase family protein [Eubacteriales bacterium]MDY3333011.1 2-hydroxyacyl-CoA dehydratase family protein [Gallibacter sp.]